MSVIELNKLTKDYGENRGIFDLDLNIEEGEMVGYVGTNGSGKTTTIRNILGFLKPTGGSVCVNGLSSWEHASEIVKNMSIYGKAYELIYADEKSKPRSVRLDPEHTFVCYSQSAFEKPLFAVYYYKKYDLDGYCTGSICRVYDESFIYTYTGLDSYTALSLQNVEPHYFFDVPIIEYRNNTEMQGDFEQLITQIDAYNVLMSDRINDKEQFVNSLLFLCNCDLDTEQAKKLLVERILMGDGDAKAEYLSKVLNEADTKVLRDDIKDDIHRLSHVPDLSDESFGNNLSGVAIKYKLLGFEQHVKNKERNFAKTLRKRLEIYNNFLVTLNAMKEVPSHRVDIGFTYNLPANELEIAQMINYLKGLASDETLLERLPFITDAKEEVEIARREQAESPPKICVSLKIRQGK